MERLTLLLLAILPLVITGFGRRVCYFSNWAQYREAGAKFLPENVDPHLCTHIVYAFATMEGNRLKPFEVNDKELYLRINALKQMNPSLKTLLGVGGWNFGTAKMTAMLATKGNRREFAKTTAEYLRKYGFNGIDLDFEYPGSRGSPAGDKDRFASLCEEMRREFEVESRASGLPVLLLTAAVAAGKDNIDKGYNVPRLSRSLDFINLMTYDLHGPWDKAIGHNAPLRGRPGDSESQKHLCMEWAAEYWHSLGAPRSQLVVGMPTYGRCFTMASPSQHNIGDPITGPGRQGRYTRQEGFLAYYEICEMARQSTAGRRVWDEAQQVPYMFDDNQWVGYDDTKSLTNKVKWLNGKGYGGWMVWNLDLDDFNGTFCGQGKYPLINAMKSALAGHYKVDGNEPAEKERPYYYRNHPTGQTRNNHLKHKNNNYPMKTRVLTHGHPPSRPWTRVYGPPMPYYPAGYGQGYLSNQVPQWSRRRYNGRNMHQPQEYHPHQDHERWNRTLPQQGVIPTPRYQGHGRPGVFSTQLLGLGPVDRETQAKRRIYLASIAKAMAGTSLRSQEVMSQPKSLVPGNTKPLYPYPHKHEFCETHKTGIHAHPNEHCFMFLWCSNGYLYEYSCGKDTVFDPKLLICHWPNAVPSRSHCAGRKTTGNHFG